MVKYNPKEWFTIIVKFPKADTFQKLLPLMITVALYCGIIAWLELYHWKLDKDSLIKNTMVLHSILGFALSMLLVFRTNTAYDRWWEGRRVWGTMVNHSRSLAIKINSFLGMNHPADAKFLLTLLGDLPFAIKNHLRKVKLWDEYEGIGILAGQTRHLVAQHLPVFLSQLLFEKINELYSQKKLTDAQFLLMNDELRTFHETCGACERIKNTPIPFSYSSFIKKFIFFFIMTMPFGLVFSIGWLSVVLVPFVLYVLASLELIAEEIENPFGKDANDLPLDEICQTIRKNIQEILVFNGADKTNEN